VEASASPIDDREVLKRFLLRLRVLLERLAQDPNDLFEPELQPLISAAWEELVAEGRFEDLDRAIDGGEYEQGMIEHGLRGAQLEFKVATFDRSLGTMLEDEQRRFRTQAKLRQSVPGALQAANVTLDSVAAFIPPAAAVKEFKNAAEAAIAKRTLIKDFFRGLNPFRRKGPEPAELRSPA
jgi:hypothetical protein